jgi:hypothetical protein
MEVEDVLYTGEETLKMVYYFQHKSLIRIIWEWIVLNLRPKVIKTEHGLEYERNGSDYEED